MEREREEDKVEDKGKIVKSEEGKGKRAWIKNS